MKYLLLSSITTLMMILTVACGGGESVVAGRLAEAEDAMAANDVDAAIHLCRELNEFKSSSSFSVAELGRLSILYMQLSDRTDDSDNVDIAVNCYREAYDLDPDSALAFYSSLPGEDDKYVMMLASISDSLENPPALDDEEPDSVNMIF